ncbi:MAG: hypothetical protein M3010_09950 [Candidatus Dormibacteraeota bacterium]|nr:hypothetical protein [Candidatus Dormibacteraeota bacterium]
MEKTTIYLPADLRLYLRDAARRTGHSQADLIREALEAQRDSAPGSKITIIGIADSSSAVPAADTEARRGLYRRHLETKFASMRERPADA